MSFKEQLLQYNQSSTMYLTEQQIEHKIESTIAQTFAWMWWCLFLAFGIAYATSQGILPLPVNGPLMMWSWVAWLGVIFFMSWKWQSLSYSTLALLLILFAFLEWYWLTWVFLSYSMWNIYNVFLTTSAMFGVLAVIGYTMKINTARVGPILMAALIWLIISMVVNMFWMNQTFDLWISVIGLVVFAWFIIYDMNILKQQALIGDKRISILMALWLLINFVNIFLFLLRLMWGRE